MTDYRTRPVPTEAPVVKEVQSPWGSFRQYAHNDEDVTVSMMEVHPGQRLSLQSHTARAELWIIIDDGAIVQVDDEVMHPARGEEIWIPAGAKHRLSSSGPTVRVLEVAFGNWQREDITRYADDYNRKPAGS